MSPIWSSVAALTVAGIYYVYRAYVLVQERKQRLLRERVAYMLWVMANGMERSKKAMSVN
jgi:hypothetical protein